MTDSVWPDQIITCWHDLWRAAGGDWPICAIRSYLPTSSSAQEHTRGGDVTDVLLYDNCPQGMCPLPIVSFFQCCSTFCFCNTVTATETVFHCRIPHPKEDQLVKQKKNWRQTCSETVAVSKRALSLVVFWQNSYIRVHGWSFNLVNQKQNSF